MRKSSLILLLTLAACSEPKRVVTGEWLEGRSRFVPQRVPAAAAEPTCRSELFTLEEVRREALHYEQQLNSGPRVNGRWKHLNLANLPIPQAKFLRSLENNYGDLNTPDALDMSACQDVPCVVNTVYQSADGMEGWATYLWYLKMGSILSFKNKVFRQASSTAGIYNEATYPLAAYLYSRDELYAFWRMSHALPTVYKTLSDMKEIQRLPRRAKFEGQDPTVCGLAYSQGYVQLNDNCLNFSVGKDSGFIYEGTTHELSHQVDYMWGKRDSDSSPYFSDIGTWRQNGGWAIEEYWDEELNKTMRRWTTTLTNEQFVRSYARTSPIEHFADTLAYYRYEGETTKRKIPTPIYEFIKAQVYEQQEYDHPGLMAQFERDVMPILTPQLFQLVMACDQNPTSRAETPPYPESMFSFSVSLNTRRCLRESVNRLADQAVVEAKLQHVDGCKVLRAADRTLAFRIRMETLLGGHMLNHLRTARENQEYYRNLNQFYRTLSERVVPLQLMTGCYGEPNEQECYDEAISELVADLVPSTTVSAENMRADLQRMFLDAFGYEQVRAETVKTHQDFLFTQTALIAESAEQLWQSCRGAALSNSAAPVPGPFSTGEHWMVSSQFNCLSLDIPDEVRQAVGQMEVEGFSVSEGKESRLLFDLALPIYVREIERLYEADRSSEEARLNELRAETTRLARARLAGFAWVRGPSSQLQAVCLQEVARVYPSDLRYHVASEVFAAESRSVCESVMGSTEFTTWLQSQRGYVEEQLTTAYIERMRAQSETRISACVREHPVNNLFQGLWNERRCRRCYTDGWALLENTAWHEARAQLQSTLPVERTSIMARANGVLQAMKKDVPDQRCQSSSLGIRLENPF